MECFCGIGIKIGMLVSHWNNKRNVSLTLEYQMERLFVIGITNGLFL